jgi:hypothetical protein
MGIIGLTDRGASFPRVGELRKGGEKVDPKRPGPDLQHFRFTSQHPDALQAFTAAYGNAPTAVNVYLPFATAGENFEAWIEEWTAGSLQWRGDGENLKMWQIPGGKYQMADEKNQRKQPKTGGKQVGRLKIIIPELGRLAFVLALTTSVHDIMKMDETLKAYQALRGDLRGIPFVFSRVPVMISTPSGPDGKRARREKWLWHLEAQTAWVQAQLSVMQRNALPGQSAQYQLTDGGAAVDVQTGEITEGDYEDDAHLPTSEQRATEEYNDYYSQKDEPQEAQFREAVAHNWQIGQLVAVTGKTAVKVGRVTAINGKLTLTLADKTTMLISADSDALSVPTGQMIAEFLYDATQGNDRQPSPKQLEKARKDMAQVIPNDIDREQFYQCVYGIDDSQQLTAGQASALIDFGGSTKDSGWQFWPTAAGEAARVIEGWRVDNGQAALPLG